MCGIAGLFSKSLDVSDNLGTHLGDMLLQLSDRGPDSAGVAVYPGDVIHGDADNITVVPAALALEMAALCELQDDL